MRSHQIIALVAVLLAAPIARADQATTLKQQGLKAAQDKNWELARDRFAQSYALDPRPLTLFNLAVAQEHTDKLVAARESYALFLEQLPPGESERFRKLARDAIPALDKAIPTLQIRATGLLTGDALEVDGSALAAAAPVALDPGSHTVVVRRGAAAVVQRTVALGRGAREDIELVVPAPPSLVPPRVEPSAPRVALDAKPPPPAQRSIVRSPWFWGVAAVVVLAAGGAGYYYFNAPTEDPMRGTLGPGVLPLP